MMRRSALAALVLLAPLAASAQVTSTGFTIRMAADPTTDEYLFNADACRDTLTVQWKYVSTGGVVCTVMSLWSTEGECGDTPGTNDVRYDDVPQLTVQSTGQGTFSVKVAELPAFKAGTTTPCGSDGLAKTHRVCGVVSTTGYDCNIGTRNALRASALKLVYDTAPPAAPTVTGVEAQDGAAKLTFTVDADATTVLAEANGPADAGFVQRGSAAASTGVVRATGLVNSEQYEIRLKAVDRAGNVSDPTPVVKVTPVPTLGFWGVYRQQGGSDPGGCAAVGGGPMVALALWLFSRRRTR